MEQGMKRLYFNLLRHDVKHNIMVTHRKYFNEDWEFTKQIRYTNRSVDCNTEVEFEVHEITKDEPKSFLTRVVDYLFNDDPQKTYWVADHYFNDETEAHKHTIGRTIEECSS
jgi:uncharacterized protein with PIN domain